jgi:hypothetical protein
MGIFDSWSDNDLLAALEEAQGDLDLAISRIVEGQTEQWDQVPAKRKEKKTTDSFTSSRGFFVY